MITSVTEAADLGDFEAWVMEPRPAVAVDTETTGLHVFGEGFRCRLIQFGDTESAWVLNVESGATEVWRAAYWALANAPRMVMHNATFDCLVIDRVGLGLVEQVMPRVVDTRLMAHLVDPRQQQDGGVGHGLKALAQHYVDPEAPDSDRALKDVFRSLGLKAAEGFAQVPIDNPELVHYAGMDVILTARLLAELGPLIKERDLARLLQFEREVQLELALMERRGMLVDQDYAGELVAELLAEEDACTRRAAELGVDKVGSPKQVAEALVAQGAELVATTPTGNLKTDRKTLAALTDGPAGELAEAVLGAKNASKFRTSYVEGTLDLLDDEGRVHPRINSLQARTARMSVSAPPLQQLPSGDARVRKMFVADPGMVIGAADYSQIELRVLGALANEKHILEAVRDGVDLHSLTAEKVGCSRKVAKGVNFLTVYGGGSKALALVAGISQGEAQAALNGFGRAFPGVKRFGRELIERAEHGAKEVITVSGRRLPLDRNRLYAATNYVVQSAARDVLAEALLELRDLGLSQYLLIPVHDEVIFQAPADEIEEVARAIGEAMTMDFQGVRLDAEGEVYGPSWGAGYE